MFATHSISLWTPDGTQFLDWLDDFYTLDCVLAEMNVGTLVLTLPATHNAAFFRRDARIGFYRAPAAALTRGQPRLRRVGDTAWLLVGRRRRLELTDQGLQETITIKAVHPNQLLARRVVAADEASAEADKTGLADNLIKAYVRENFTASSDTTRNWSATTLFAVDADTSKAPSVQKAASYRTVLTVCQELAAAGTTAGTYTGFEVVGAENGPFHLRTYTGQRGSNRSSTGQSRLIISAARREFDTVELDEDWSDIASFVYAGGAGKKDERIVTASWDTALMNETPYGRIEYFQTAGGTDDPAVTTDEADRALRERRPRKLFNGSVKDTEAATFGEEYDWGDRVVAEYARPDPQGTGFVDVQQFDCRVDPVHIHVERSEDPETGEQRTVETLDIRLRSEM